jgi:hypothetical protein
MQSNRSSCHAQTSDGNLAARAGRWSAQHGNKAIAGWPVSVILAVVAGGSVRTQTFDESDYGIGESGRDAAISEHFPDKEDESVLVQSQNGALRLADPNRPIRE